jgi:flagellar hook protein FlgE
MMIQGDGFFIVKNGGENLFTRAGSFTFDANGALTTANGDIVQGWTATNGVVNNAGLPGDIKLPIGVTLSPSETTNITLTGNFSNDAVPNDATDATSTKQIPIKSVYDATGAEVPLTVTLTKTATDTWTIDVPAHGTTAADSQPITFTNGRATGTVTAGGFTFDVSALTQFSGGNDARVSNSDGAAAGVLRSYTVSNSGEIVGVFSNGLTETLGQVALANFNNANGLEKVGESMYRSTPNSGLAQIGAAGTTGLGTIMSGALEMSNVDLAQEFTNLVIAQRGFQANSRVITTSDELLQELVNLKR